MELGTVCKSQRGLSVPSVVDLSELCSRDTSDPLPYNKKSMVSRIQDAVNNSARFVESKQAAGLRCYSLQGVVRHVGSSPYGGHYIADVLTSRKCKDSGSEMQWVRCDDSIVRDVSEAQVTESPETPYLLLYKIINI
jgi:ubiquitin C-terminal hydrolase